MAKDFKITQLNRQMAIVDKDGVLHFPEGVTSIGIGAFRALKNICTVTIPDTVTEIGDEAFANCTSLASVKLGAGIRSIKQRTFMGCERLAKIHIPDGVESIDSGAFADCKSLAQIHIPDSVESIGSNAFAGCKSLRAIAGGAGLKNIHKDAFEDCLTCYRYTETKVDGAIEVDGVGFFAPSPCTEEELYTLPSFSAGYLWRENGSFEFDRCGSDYEFCYDEDDRSSSGSFDNIYDLSVENCLVKDGNVIGFCLKGVSLLLNSPKKHVHRNDSYNGVTDIRDTTWSLVKKTQKGIKNL